MPLAHGRGYEAADDDATILAAYRGRYGEHPVQLVRTTACVIVVRVKEEDDGNDTDG